MHKGF